MPITRAQFTFFRAIQEPTSSRPLSRFILRARFTREPYIFNRKFHSHVRYIVYKQATQPACAKKNAARRVGEQSS